MLKLFKPPIQYSTISELCMCRRFKGHSKWQNIKHIKAAKDAEKSFLTQQFVKQMKIAVARSGGVTNPEANFKLANIIEAAKKSNISPETLKTSLKKIQESKEKTEDKYLSIKGPSGSYFLLHILTSNFKHLRITQLNGLAKKYNVQIMDQIPKGLFEHKGIILTNTLKDVEKATDDAIMCDAEEVEEIEDSETSYLQFTCDPDKLMMVKTKLDKLNYETIKVEEQYLPKTAVQLNEEQDKNVSKFLTKLEEIDEVVDVFHNIE